MISLILYAVACTLYLGYLEYSKHSDIFNRRARRRPDLRTCLRENICHLCGEQYVGLAQDCRCTNWGK
jgi:hypothetical protein